MDNSSTTLVLNKLQPPEYQDQVNEQMKRIRALVKNKNGSRKNHKKLSTIMKHALDIIYDCDPDLEPELHGLTYREVIILRVMDKAARDGDLGAFDRIIDRLEGKAVQKSESTETKMNYLEYIMEVERKERQDDAGIADLYEEPHPLPVAERASILQPTRSEN